MIRIGGLSPLTSIDYPGELAAVIFCQGCPWRCGYCHNPHLLPPESDTLIPWAQVEAFLRRRLELLDAVVFSGGEPCLQDDLPSAMAQVKTLGFKIGLHTGGIYPERLPTLLPYLDWVGLDIKALPEDYPALTGVPGSGERAWESLRLLLAARVPLEVRTTLPADWRLARRTEELMSRLAREQVESYALQTRRDRECAIQDRSLTEFPTPPPPEAYAKLGEGLFRHFVLR